MMVTLVPPEFVSVTACVWLVPTATPPKLMFEGLSVICPLAANAVDARKRIAGKKANKRNPHGIPLQQGEELLTV